MTYPLTGFIKPRTPRVTPRPSIYTAAELPPPLNRIDRDALRRWARERELTVTARRRDPDGRHFTDEVAIDDSTPMRDVAAAVAAHLNAQYHQAGDAAIREHLRELAEVTP